MNTAPIFPAPLSPDEFHTREAIRAHQQAEQAYHAHQRAAARKIQIDADNARSKAIVEANKELSDIAYDEIKRKEWQASKDKQAAILAKEKQDALEKTAFLLSSPEVVDLYHRSEFSFLREFAHWSSRNYTLPDDGVQVFQPGHYAVRLTAPAPKKAVK